jgi:hypothetical protein
MCFTKVMWRIRLMRELLKHGSLEERDWATAVECCQAEPYLPSLPLALLRTVRCYVTRKHWTAQQWGVVWPLWCHAQQYTTLCSPACQTPAFIGETEGSSASFSTSQCTHVSCNREFKTVCNREFTTSSQSIIEVSYWRELRRLLLWREDFCGIFGV